MKSILSRFAKDGSGATAIEYGVSAAIVALAALAGAGTVGTDLGAKFTDIATKFASMDDGVVGVQTGYAALPTDDITGSIKRVPDDKP